MQRMKLNEADADRRIMYFPLVVDNDDGLSPETGEAGGQPQYSLDGGATWTNTTNSLSGGTNGAYHVHLTQEETNLVGAGEIMLGRYKSAETAEARAIPIQFEADPFGTPLSVAAFLEALLTGGDVTVEGVLRMLYQKAVGYLEAESGDERIYGPDGQTLLRTLQYDEVAGVITRTPVAP